MSYIRGQERSVAQTVHDYLLAQLTTLGWFAAVGSLPFGAQDAVTLTEEMPVVDGPILPNTVAFTMGVIPDDEPGELGASGGGLWLTTYTFFVDVFGENKSMARAIASDVRAVLAGKLAGTNRFQQLIDFSQTPPVLTAALIEFKDIESVEPTNQIYQRDWAAVKVTAELQFNGIEHS